MDVYDEVDRRENDAGEPRGHRRSCMGRRDEVTCPPAGEGLGPLVVLWSFTGDCEGLLGVGWLSSSTEPPLLAVSGLGSLPGPAACFSTHLWTGAHLGSGCLPLWLTPQSHSAPLYTTPSRPQPDSRPNSGLGLARRSRLVLLFIGLAGLAQPCPDWTLLPLSEDHPCFAHQHLVGLGRGEEGCAQHFLTSALWAWPHGHSG